MFGQTVFALFKKSASKLELDSWLLEDLGEHFARIRFLKKREGESRIGARVSPFSSRLCKLFKKTSR